MHSGDADVLYCQIERQMLPITTSTSAERLIQWALGTETDVPLVTATLEPMPKFHAVSRGTYGRNEYSQDRILQ